MSKRVRRTLRGRSVLSAAVDYVEDLGLYLPERPHRDIPALPEDLTELGDSDLMVLFTEFTAWTNYAVTKRSLAETEEAEAEAEHALAEATAIILGWDEDTGAASDRRVTIAKARRLQDRKVQEALQTKREAHARRKIIGVMAETMERNSALISRELSRRIGSGDVHRRSSRWNP